MGLCLYEINIVAFNCGGSLRQLGMPAWKGRSTDRYRNCVSSRRNAGNVTLGTRGFNACRAVSYKLKSTARAICISPEYWGAPHKLMGRQK